ncbi:MAG: ATP synthase subunit I [Gammaproteobacteria bacterium]|nr:MAG: ATP synthase subunit I [Gammaproteobacteria bacterium]
MSTGRRKLIAGLPLEYRLVGLQGAVLALVTLGLVLLTGPHQSFLAGGLCALVPNAWMAWRVRRRMGTDAGREAWRMLFGAFEKLALTVGLLAFSLLRLEDLSAPAFFAGFIVALATHHAALVLDTGDGREA